MALFRKNEVRNAVMKIMDERLETAQADYEDGSKKISTDEAQAIEAIMDTSRVRRDSLLETCVAEVFR